MNTKFLFFALVLASISMHCNLDRIDDAGPFVCGQSFVDPRDGKSYKTVWIADDGSHDLSKAGQCWMAENLNFNTSNFGSDCFAQQAIQCDTFGRLYNETVLGNICMNGWHIATSTEWSNLFKRYGWTELFTGNGPIYSGDSSVFLPGGISKLNFLMGGSCLEINDCEGIGDNTGFWATDENFFTFFGKSGNADVWTTAVIIGDPDLRYYVRCVKN